MAKHDLHAAQRLMAMIVAKNYRIDGPSPLAPIIEALGKTDPASALRMAKTQPLDIDAQLAAAACQPKATVKALLQDIFSDEANRTIQNIVRANAIDPELGKALYAYYRQHLAAKKETERISDYRYAYLISSIDPTTARLMLERGYALELDKDRRGEYCDVGSFMLGMCALDFERARQMFNELATLNPNDHLFRPIFLQRMMHYILMSREERMSWDLY